MVAMWGMDLAWQARRMSGFRRFSDLFLDCSCNMVRILPSSGYRRWPDDWAAAL